MKLSKTQQQVVDTLRRTGAPLVRVPGGFWTYQGCPVSRPGIPEWWVSVPTVRALERLGVLERTNQFPEEWRDSRKLAENG